MKKIVLIDDDLDVREVFVFALQNEGLEVTTFENGIEALQGLAKMTELPGLIIVDYLMPQMDGVTFINEMRKSFPETFAKVPVAVSSALGDHAPELRNVPHILQLSKPIELDELLRVAKHYCH